MTKDQEYEEAPECITCEHLYDCTFWVHMTEEKKACMNYKRRKDKDC